MFMINNQYSAMTVYRISCRRVCIYITILAATSGYEFGLVGSYCFGGLCLVITLSTMLNIIKYVWWQCFVYNLYNIFGNKTIYNNLYNSYKFQLDVPKRCYFCGEMPTFSDPFASSLGMMRLSNTMFHQRLIRLVGCWSCWLLLLLIVGVAVDCWCCCWLLLIVVAVDCWCCCWLLLIVVDGCCLLLIVVAVAVAYIHYINCIYLMS